MAGDEDEAVQAFERLRAEVSLMRLAVERLAAERTETVDTPDYSETLSVISHNLSATAQRVDALAKTPVLSLTPEETSRQINAASLTARRDDQRLFSAARQGLEEVAARLERHMQSNVVAREQQRRLSQTGLAGIAAGIMLWAILAGPIARLLPARWLVPERIAARSLRMSMWEGGQHLMWAGDARAFASILAGNRLVTTNYEMLKSCRKRADKAKKVVRCAIKVGAAK